MTFTQKSLVKLDQKLLDLPDSLQEAIRSAWEQHYEELYEPEADETSPLLEEAIRNILEAFQEKVKLVNHVRYVWMALLLVIAVEPTIKYYQPKELVSQKVINRLIHWLTASTVPLIRKKDYSKQRRDKVFEDIEQNCFVAENKNRVGSWQTLTEAFDVYRNAIESLDDSKAVESLVESLDDCLEGYAIFPGSQGRRELFKWWLHDIVPASLFLRTPELLYPVRQSDYFEDFEKIKSERFEQLAQISHVVQYVHLEYHQSTDRNSL